MSTSSRLSPLARPFTINPSNSSLPHQNSILFSSNFTLESAVAAVPSFHFDVSPTSEFTIPSPVSQLPYAIGGFQLTGGGDSDFEVIMPISGTVTPHYPLGSFVPDHEVDHPGIPGSIFNLYGGFSSRQKQANNPTKGLKLGGETSDHLWTGIPEKDNEIVFRDAKCVSFPTTSKLCPSFVFNCPETNPQFSCSLDSKSSAVEISGSSDCSTCNLHLDSLLLHKMEPDGVGASCNDNPLIYSPVTMKEPSNPLNSKDMEASLEVLMDKSKDGMIGKPIIKEFMDALPIPESGMQVADPGLPHDLALKLPSAEEGKPVGLDDNDSDLDSPCWRGTLAAKQETFENSGPVDSLVSQRETGTCWKETLSANEKPCADSGTASVHFETGPMASCLFQRNDKQSISYYVNECAGDDFSFFLETTSSAVNLLAEEQRSANPVLEKSCSDRRHIIGTHCSNDICSQDKEDDLKNSSSSTFPSFSGVCPSYAETHCKSKLKVMTEPNVAVSVRENKDEVHSIPLASKTFCCSSSCRVGVPTSTETHVDANRSFSKPPRLDIQKIVITMNKLSKLLMKNCSNDLDSLNEHGRDILKHIIDNLNLCIGNRAGESTLLPDSSQLYGSNCLRKSANLQKGC